MVRLKPARPYEKKGGPSKRLNRREALYVASALARRFAAASPDWLRNWGSKPLRLASAGRVAHQSSNHHQQPNERQNRDRADSAEHSEPRMGVIDPDEPGGSGQQP